MLWAALPHGIFATGSDSAATPPTDPAPCVAAISASDDDRIVAACGVLIDSDRAEKADRIKALIARAGVYDRKDMLERAIDDYGTVLRLDPSLADIFNARGELWRRKGDRPKALQDFGAAIRLNPIHPQAKANYKSLALELERLGALLAVNNKPSFNCATAKRPVEKAICADPGLAQLDRSINDVFLSAIADAESSSHQTALALTRQQREFIDKRNTSFGRRGYDLRQAMEERLDRLNTMARR